MFTWLKAIVIVFALSISLQGVAGTTEDILTELDYVTEMWEDRGVTEIEKHYHPEFQMISDDGITSLESYLAELGDIDSSNSDRGKLQYSDIVVKELSVDHALAYGKLTLKFNDGSEVTSWFTTIFIKTSIGWKAWLTRS